MESLQVSGAFTCRKIIPAGSMKTALRYAAISKQRNWSAATQEKKPCRFYPNWNKNPSNGINQKSQIV
jgi:hypothetical protein